MLPAERRVLMPKIWALLKPDGVIVAVLDTAEPLDGDERPCLG
jgi:hypothetical protein